MLLSVSLNISTFLDLLTGIKILLTCLKLFVFSKVSLRARFCFKFLKSVLFNKLIIFCMSLLFTDKLFRIFTRVSPLLILYSIF